MINSIERVIPIVETKHYVLRTYLKLGDVLMFIRTEREIFQEENKGNGDVGFVEWFNIRWKRQGRQDISIELLNEPLFAIGKNETSDGE